MGHTAKAHRADMSCLEGMRRWMWSFLLPCPSSLIRIRGLPLAAHTNPDPGEARRRKACCEFFQHAFPHARWNRAPSPSPPKLNLISRHRRLPSFAHGFPSACEILSSPTAAALSIASDTGDVAFREALHVRLAWLLVDEAREARSLNRCCELGAHAF